MFLYSSSLALNPSLITPPSLIVGAVFSLIAFTISEPKSYKSPIFEFISANILLSSEDSNSFNSGKRISVCPRAKISLGETLPKDNLPHILSISQIFESMFIDLVRFFISEKSSSVASRRILMAALSVEGISSQLRNFLAPILVEVRSISQRSEPYFLPVAAFSTSSNVRRADVSMLITPLSFSSSDLLIFIKLRF